MKLPDVQPAVNFTVLSRPVCDYCKEPAITINRSGKRFCKGHYDRGFKAYNRKWLIDRGITNEAMTEEEWQKATAEYRARIFSEMGMKP